MGDSGSYDAERYRVRAMAALAGFKLQGTRSDGTYQIVNDATRRIIKGKGRDHHGLSLSSIERWLLANCPECAPRVSHPLRAKLEECGGSLEDWTVLSPATDPFRMDRAANLVNGRWLADIVTRVLGTTKIHNRGLHYVLMSSGVAKPDGTRYGTKDWEFLEEASKAARWLGYIPFDQITDEKNAEPVIRIREPVEPLDYITPSDLEDVTVPGADECQPTVKLDNFTGTQPYRIAMIGEKSSLETVLGPISERYGTDLCLLTGNISNVRIYQIASAAAQDGRPLVVLYFSDCDPWGWHMGIEAARKLQAFKHVQFPWLQFRVYRAALTPDQVREHDLPESPIEKGSEAKAQDWFDQMGVEQTEIDAIATLQPDLLRDITEQWIGYFWDDTLDDRVARARGEWIGQAQQVVDDGIDQDELDSAVAELDRLRGEVQDIIDDRVQPILDAADEIELPDLPDIPEPDIDEESAPKGLIDSRWSFRRQTRRLIDQKNYDATD